MLVMDWKDVVFLLYRGLLVFEDSHRITSEEFTKQKAYFKKLGKYYDKVHEDEDLRKLHECAKCENHTPKNYVPTDGEDEEITEVGSIVKDTETEEDNELPSGEESSWILCQLLTMTLELVLTMKVKNLMKSNMYLLLLRMCQNMENERCIKL